MPADLRRHNMGNVIADGMAAVLVCGIATMRNKMYCELQYMRDTCRATREDDWTELSGYSQVEAHAGGGCIQGAPQLNQHA